MQVILLQDVKGQGKKGQVIEVNEGYARNFLIKKGFAEAATASKLNDLKQKQAAADFHKAEQVKAIIDMNRKGQFPEQLEDYAFIKEQRNTEYGEEGQNVDLSKLE